MRDNNDMRMPRATLCGLVVALMLVTGCGGDEAASLPTGPSSTPSSTPAPPSNPGALAVQMLASGGTCVAPGDAPVSCTFVAQVSGGQAPYTYTWTFWAGSEGRVTVQGQSVRPTFDCRFSTGESEFRVYMSLRVDQSGGGSSMTINNDQRVYRASGHC
jgi:hypothetical protein